MKELIRKILFEENLKETGYYGNVLSRKLSQELDNRLYTLIYMVGGMTTADVIHFADNATSDEVNNLYEKIMKFPSTQQDLIPLAGGHVALGESETYQEIVDLVKFKNRSLMEQKFETDMYFDDYLSSSSKEKLFRYWDQQSYPDYDALKLFGVEEDVDEDLGDFRNVGDIVYPLLAIEWLGGVENTKFAQAPWRETSENGWYKLKFKVEPINFDYMYDEQERFGESGYACWNIRVLIDKEGDFDPPSEREDDEIPFIQDLFPESARNKLSSHNNYTEDQFEVIEMLWDEYDDVRDWVRQFCMVEVILV